MAQANNMFLFMGRLTADPELQDAGQSKLLRVRMACDRPPKRDEQGNVVTDPNTGRVARETDFITVKFWGKRAEGLARVLKKGVGISVTGSVRVTSKPGEGEAKGVTYTDFMGDELEFTGAKPANANNSAPAEQAQQQSQPPVGAGTGAGNQDW